MPTIKQEGGPGRLGKRRASSPVGSDREDARRYNEDAKRRRLQQQQQQQQRQGGPSKSGGLSASSPSRNPQSQQQRDPRRTQPEPKSAVRPNSPETRPPGLTEQNTTEHNIIPTPPAEQITGPLINAVEPPKELLGILLSSRDLTHPLGQVGIRTSLEWALSATRDKAITIFGRTAIEAVMTSLRENGIAASRAEDVEQALRADWGLWMGDVLGGQMKTRSCTDDLRVLTAVPPRAEGQALGSSPRTPMDSSSTRLPAIPGSTAAVENQTQTPTHKPTPTLQPLQIPTGPRAERTVAVRAGGVRVAGTEALYPSNLAPPARLIPFVKTQGRDSNRMLNIVASTPDVPMVELCAAQLYQACLDSFGTGSQFEDMRQCSEYVWVAEFASNAAAARAKGKIIDVGGVQLVAEHCYSTAPSVFIADFSDVDVSEEEVAKSIAEAFEGQTGGPTLRIQQAAKLYAGRHFRVDVPRSVKVLCFYVSVLERDGKSVHNAYFQPLDGRVACVLCREKHGWEPCVHSRAVELPASR